jgi:AcrR family transcriptional regulator
MAEGKLSQTAVGAVVDAVESEEGPMTPNKRRIVEMTIRAFAEQGYAATTTRDIAERAGVSEAAIFRHFTSKKELLLRLVRPLVSKVVVPTGIEDLRTAFAAETSVEGIVRQMLTTRLAAARQYAPLIKIILQEAPFHPELRTELGKSVGVAREQIDLILASSIADLQVRAIETERLLRWLASLLLGYLFLSGLPVDRQWDDAAEIDAMAGFVARGLAADRE